MKTSNKLNLKVIENLDEENIRETLQSYSDNFEILDDVYRESIADIKTLKEGSYHERGKIYFNSSPVINGYAGWININAGYYTPKTWERRKEYKFGDLIMPTERNGYVYRCVVEGTSAYHEPSFPTSSGVYVDDLYLIQDWLPEHNYDVGEIVVNPQNKSVYYECITAGLTGEEEPDWETIVGTTVIDGTVTWLVHKTVRWENYGRACEFRPFGKIE